VAEYSDWEIHTDTKAQMDAGARALGFTQGDGFLNGVRYTIYIYGTKYVWDGTYVPAPIGGTMRNMVAQPGSYAILRWFSPTPFPPVGMNVPNYVTIVPLPADSPHVFS